MGDLCLRSRCPYYTGLFRLEPSSSRTCAKDRGSGDLGSSQGPTPWSALAECCSRQGAYSFRCGRRYQSSLRARRTYLSGDQARSCSPGSSVARRFLIGRKMVTVRRNRSTPAHVRARISPMRIPVWMAKITSSRNQGVAGLGSASRQSSTGLALSRRLNASIAFIPIVRPTILKACISPSTTISISMQARMYSETVIFALLAHFSIKAFSSSVTRNCIICVFITPPMYVTMNGLLYVNMNYVSRPLRQATAGSVSVGPPC
jgi:hypothetical protein